MSSESLIGQTIGNYRVISRLGRGGMATVYRARQVTMGRDVALKVMSDDIAQDPEYEARFEREAQVIANLQHPRVLPVHDFGRDGDVFYLTMRLIEGESLYQRLMRGPLPLAHAARYVNQIAEALDYAHSQSVIHRDLKPNNVLLDELDNVYLMDFGLAKMLAATHSLTQTGAVIGTPQYMAPEQWRGEAVDARTDVYSLGVILYEMVVGRPPFESDTPFTLMYKHVNDPPPAPRDSLPQLPEAVETVILKALAKLPADRYESAGALARALTQSLREAREPGADLLIPPPDLNAPPEDDAAESAAPDAPAPDDAGAVTGDAIESASDALPEPDIAPPEPSSESVPLPAQIIPPPPPIPLPGDLPRGAPDARKRRPPPHESASRAERTPPQSAVRRALDAVDHSLESALEKAAFAAPPLSGPSSDPDLHLAQGVKYSPQGVPLNAPALATVRGLLHPNEPLVGVLDVRGTHQWKLWKQLLVGGLMLGIVGGVIGSGMVSLLGWLAWIFLAVQGFRTYRGDIGRYYLGFTPDRVVLLPRDADNDPRYSEATGVAWTRVERLRLTDRYVLLDMLDGEGGTLHLGALLPAQGDGGLGPQSDWLPYSPITDLIADQGFDVQGT